MKLKQSQMQRLDALLQSEVEAIRLPGVAYAVGIGDDIVHQNAIGFAENLHGKVRPMQIDTLFDLASLTKVVATLPCILFLVDEGQIRLDDPVALFIPEFATDSSICPMRINLAEVRAFV